METVEKIYRQSFFLSAGETNPEQEMSVPVLVSKIIDVATAHANALGIGNPSMVEMRAGWILSRVSVEMVRWPRVNETYTVATWIESFNRHFSERDFSFSDNEGNILGYARTVWMVMGVDTHENVGLGHFSLPQDMISGEGVPIPKQQRHRQILPADTPADSIPSGAVLADYPAARYRFKYCDLDSYRHVNTVRYVDLLLNQFSLEDFDLTAVSRLELSFLREARYGMTVDILRRDRPADERGEEGALVSSISLADSEDSTPILYARIFRQERN